MLTHMHVLSSPMIQQHVAIEQQILSREWARTVQPSLPCGLGVLLEVAGGNKQPRENSNPVCHFLAAGDPCFRSDVSDVTERLSVLTFQRSWLGRAGSLQQ